MVDRRTCQISMMTGSTNGRRPRALAQKAPQLHSQLFLDQSLIGAFLDARLLHDLDQHARGVREKGLAVLHDEARA